MLDGSGDGSGDYRSPTKGVGDGPRWSAELQQLEAIAAIQRRRGLWQRFLASLDRATPGRDRTHWQ